MQIIAFYIAIPIMACIIFYTVLLPMLQGDISLYNAVISAFATFENLLSEIWSFLSQTI